MKIETVFGVRSLPILVLHQEDADVTNEDLGINLDRIPLNIGGEPSGGDLHFFIMFE